MRGEIQISIIIPCYRPNEGLLKKCIDSIIKQTFDSFEVLIVENGNTKKDLFLIDRISKFDNRIKVISSEEKGVSNARNLGIKCAIGRYVTFVDCDDALSENFLKEAFDIAEINQADWVGFMITRSEDNVLRRDIPLSKITRYNGKEVQELSNRILGEHISGSNGLYLGVGPWGKLIRNSSENLAQFNCDLVIFEDIIWNIETIRKAKLAIIVDQLGYLYSENNLSTTKRFNPCIVTQVEKQIYYLDTIGNLDDKVFYKSYGDNLFRCLRVISESLINNQDSLLNRNSKKEILYHIYFEKPWIFLKNKDYYLLSSKKTRMKIFLYKIRCYFLFKKVFNI